MTRKVFLQVDLELPKEVGCDAAILLAALQNFGKIAQRDKRGYFAVSTQSLCMLLGWDRRKLIRTREKLLSAGKIKVMVGANQNNKSRYKIK